MLAVFSAVFSPSDALAIPAFSREYEVPCQTCHYAITRRNEFGDAFRLNGYHWPGEAGRDLAGRKAAPVGIKGISLLEGFLPKHLPLAISGSFSGAYSNDPNLTDPITLGSPVLTVLLGGAISEHVGFFGTWNGRSAPNELYLHFTHFFSRPEFNLRLGRFEQTTTMFKTNEGLIARYLLGSSNLDGFAVSTGRIGAEVNGVLFNRIFYAVGAVDQTDGAGEVVAYYHVRAKLGGMDFLGQEPDMDLEEPSLSDDITLTLAHWGARGGVDGTSGERAGFVRRLGFEGTVGFKDLTLSGGAMFGFDLDLAARRNVHNLTWFAELSYAPVSWLVLLYIFQYQDSAAFTQETMQHDAGALVLLLENVRLRAKVGVSDDDVKNEVAELQFLSAF
jgi:hypothetical protein